MFKLTTDNVQYAVTITRYTRFIGAKYKASDALLG